MCIRDSNDTGGFFECDEEETLAILGVQSDSGGDIPFIGMWPWAVGVLAILAACGGIGSLIWRRFLAVPNNPRIAFRRMTTLALLASAGPAEFQTPNQIGSQLREMFPAQGTSISIIIAGYVRSRYGNKHFTTSELRQLAIAWRKFRLPMIAAVIRKRML